MLINNLQMLYVLSILKNNQDGHLLIQLMFKEAYYKIME